MSVEEITVPKPETEQVPAAETTEAVTKPEAKTEEATVEAEVEIAKRAFALKNYEEAVDHYATALEIARTEYGENTPSFADLLLKYGRALIENAIAQNSVLGAKQGDEAPKEPNGAGSSSDSKTQPGNGRIHFGDGQSSDDEDGVGDETVDTAAGDLPAVNEEGEGEEQQDEDEPEDDFNAAWDVLDLARAYYDKQEGDDMKLKLSEAYMSLGDVSLETEKFEQAISDYTSGLSIKTQLLPFYSRQVCEAHYRLALAFDLTPNKSDGIRHIEQALSSLKARVTVIKDRLESPPDTKGKEKGKGIAINDPIDTMDEVQLQAELKDVEELLNDLSLKHEDMKAVPEGQNQVEDEAAGVKKALDDWLKPSLPAAEEPPQMDGPVNDLSKLVKKKKKPAASALPEAETSGSGAPPNAVAAGKRKVEVEEVQDEASPVEKKVKLTTE